MTIEEKRKSALEYLGTRHCLHPAYDGKHSHNPREVDVEKTIRGVKKRIQKEREQEQAAFSKVINVRQINRR